MKVIEAALLQMKVIEAAVQQQFGSRHFLIA
jgi:hypothetical protein